MRYGCAHALDGYCFTLQPPPHTLDRPTVGGTGNLLGSVSTMDCDLGVEACIAWYRKQLNQGLVSRDGWVLVDDSANPALVSANFSEGSLPWRVERPWTRDYQASSWARKCFEKNALLENTEQLAVQAGLVFLRPWP